MESFSPSKRAQLSSFDVLTQFIELYLLVVGVDVVLAWVQEDPRRWPRRLTHALTEPILIWVRKGMRGWSPGGWDLSPLVLIVGLTCLKLGLRGTVL